MFVLSFLLGFYFTLSSQGYRYDVGWYDQ